MAPDCKAPQLSHKYTLVRAEFLISLNKDLPERIHDGYLLSEGETILEVGAYTDAVGQRILDAYRGDLHIVARGARHATECPALNPSIPPLDPAAPIPRIPMIQGILLPGYVKAHGHDHESPIIGIAKDVPLTAWLDGAVNPSNGFYTENCEELTKVFGKAPHLVVFRKARVDDLYYGITSAMTMACNFSKYKIRELVQANVEAGTKMIAAVGAQDRFYDARILDTPQVAVDRLDTYVAELGDAPRSRIVPGPDQLFSNGPELLKALKAWADKNDTLIHIHSSEEPGTTKWFTEKFGMTPIQYADSIGFLGPRTVVAHQVNTTAEDMELLRARGVKVAHNPLANTILGSGMPAIPEMLAAGIPVAISTDGSGSADAQNMIGAARCSSQYFRGRDADPALLPARQCLEMVTCIPAEMLELNTGRLQPGMDADWQVIDVSKPNMSPTHIKNCLENWLWCCDGSEARYVASCGVVLKDDFELKGLGFDVEENLSEIRELTGLLMEYMATEAAQSIKGTGAHQ
jgi:5-methylthioadenosine/S-adenosylhomocysteine deaminase